MYFRIALNKQFSCSSLLNTIIMSLYHNVQLRVTLKHYFFIQLSLSAINMTVIYLEVYTHSFTPQSTHHNGKPSEVSINFFLQTNILTKIFSSNQMFWSYHRLTEVLADFLWLGNQLSQRDCPLIFKTNLECVQLVTEVFNFCVYKVSKQVEDDSNEGSGILPMPFKVPKSFHNVVVWCRVSSSSNIAYTLHRDFLAKQLILSPFLLERNYIMLPQY